MLHIVTTYAFYSAFYAASEVVFPAIYHTPMRPVDTYRGGVGERSSELQVKHSNPPKIQNIIDITQPKIQNIIDTNYPSKNTKYHSY